MPDTSAPLSEWPGATPLERLRNWAAARYLEKFGVTEAAVETLVIKALKDEKWFRDPAEPEKWREE